MIKWMKVAAAIVSTASLAGAANADLIAGWDFSQYGADGSLDAGAGAVDTLPANYSSLDATYGAGGTDPGDSADFGTMYMDGSNGSTNVTEGAATPGPEAVAHANDTSANRLGPVSMRSAGGLPINAFDAFNVLLGEGQANQQRMALTARAPCLRSASMSPVGHARPRRSTGSRASSVPRGCSRSWRAPRSWSACCR